MDHGIPYIICSNLCIHVLLPRLLFV